MVMSEDSFAPLKVIVMKPRTILLSALSLSFTTALQAQYAPPDPAGLEGVIVEKYYVADANDAADEDGGTNLPAGSTTYRVFVDMLDGYKLLANTAAITYGMPLDRTTEEAIYRETQIRLEQRKRDLRTLTDQVAIEARAAVRGIEKAQFTLLISERNVETSNRRLESIQAAEDRATPRDRTEAVNNAQQAADNLESAKRDLQIAILGYLLSTGQMRINAAGELTTPPGMEQGTRPPAP